MIRLVEDKPSDRQKEYVKRYVLQSPQTQIVVTSSFVLQKACQ